MKLSSVVCVGLCFVLSGCSAMGGSSESEKDDKPMEAVGVDELQNLVQKADIFYQTKDYAQSKTLYEQVVERDPKNLKALYRLGNISFRGRDWADARRMYEQVVAIQPRHTRAQYNLSMTYLTMAERHLKFYAANVDSNTNLDSVTKLITALEEISNPAAVKRARKQTGPSPADSSLDRLLDELAK